MHYRVLCKAKVYIYDFCETLHIVIYLPTSSAWSFKAAFLNKNIMVPYSLLITTYHRRNLDSANFNFKWKYRITRNRDKHARNNLFSWSGYEGTWDPSKCSVRTERSAAKKMFCSVLFWQNMSWFLTRMHFTKYRW